MRKKSGFTLVEVMIIVAIMGILVGMALPGFYQARLTTRKAVCINNQRQIESAIDEWAMMNGISNGVSVAAEQEDEIYIYIRGGKPECPSGGNYTIGTIGSYPQVTCDVEGHTYIEE